MNITEYSVVIPVFNSASTLPELYERLQHTFSQINQRCEVIMVNDCSSDNSWEVIKTLKEKAGDNLIAISLRKNSGQHKALLCGFHFARGKFIITLDDDLQFFPEDIVLLINRIHETNADMVYGVYEGVKQHNLLRRWGSRAVAYIFERFGNTVGQGSSFKIIRSDVIDKIKHYNHSFTFLDEILSWHATKIEWQQVRHAPRREGSSGYSIPRLIFLTLNLIFAYTTIPLRFMTWFGLLSFIVCFGFIIYFTYRKIMYGTVIGFTALIVSVMLSTGLIMFSLGIIGEYLNRLFALQHRKPPFLIREILK
ncbi:MAG: glycosyltransferase [Chitinophagales bacterium]|nr:glycosyltransferase [Chitinophagales bacterium]MDW8418152.1 glycosyltransferase [Chitinophagales bacterium]